MYATICPASVDSQCFEADIKELNLQKYVDSLGFF